jgi:hypothetical protein
VCCDDRLKRQSNADIEVSTTLSRCWTPSHMPGSYARTVADQLVAGLLQHTVELQNVRKLGFDLITGSVAADDDILWQLATSSNPDRRAPNNVCGDGCERAPQARKLQPGCHATVPTAGTAPALTKTIRTITTLGSRSRGRTIGMHWSMHAIAADIHIGIDPACRMRARGSSSGWYKMRRPRGGKRKKSNRKQTRHTHDVPLRSNKPD